MTTPGAGSNNDSSGSPSPPGFDGGASRDPLPSPGRDDQSDPVPPAAANAGLGAPATSGEDYYMNEGLGPPAAAGANDSQATDYLQVTNYTAPQKSHYAPLVPRTLDGEPTYQGLTYQGGDSESIYEALPGGGSGPAPMESPPPLPPPRRPDMGSPFRSESSNAGISHELGEVAENGQATPDYSAMTQSLSKRIGDNLDASYHSLASAERYRELKERFPNNASQYRRVEEAFRRQATEYRNANRELTRQYSDLMQKGQTYRQLRRMQGGSARAAEPQLGGNEARGTNFTDSATLPRGLGAGPRIGQSFDEGGAEKSRSLPTLFAHQTDDPPNGGQAARGLQQAPSPGASAESSPLFAEPRQAANVVVRDYEGISETVSNMRQVVSRSESALDQIGQAQNALAESAEGQTRAASQALLTQLTQTNRRIIDVTLRTLGYLDLANTEFRGFEGDLAQRFFAT
ncbi:WXG100 family type VII secretion target [Mycobacterium sp.]|uniref:WXG100 family type VII secretion target n=1 Tax=Mycobacterium sp. TaxID=1785 RepID=UPI003BAD4B2B